MYRLQFLILEVMCDFHRRPLYCENTFHKSCRVPLCPAPIQSLFSPGRESGQTQLFSPFLGGEVALPQPCILVVS